MISISSLAFKYSSGRFSLSCPKFVAYPGKVTCLIGGNGTGKSTFLSLIGKRLLMNSGSIDFFDDLGTSKQEYECINLEVGGMTRLVMEMTVQDHLCLALSVSNRSLPLFFRHATIDTIAKCCESYCASLFEPLRSVFFSRIVELSSGQRQKLSCAIGLLNAKEVTLCDETTAHLDVSASDYFFRLLKGTVSQRGIVNVVVTHDIMLAAKYADRFYVIANGTVRDFDVSSCVGWESKADMLSKFIVYNS